MAAKAKPVSPAVEDWLSEADDWVHSWLIVPPQGYRFQFTAELVAEHVGYPDNEHILNGDNTVAFSKFFNKYWKQLGYIKPIGWKNSTTPSRKGGDIRIWEVVYQPGEAS
jgi:hypothetical protein